MMRGHVVAKAGRTGMVLLVLAAGVPALKGWSVLVGSNGMDQGSPIPAVDLWCAAVGILASLVLVHAVIDFFDGRLTGFVLVPLLALLLAVVPLWLRDYTLDVEDAGFHRAHYGIDNRDFRIYNATDRRIRVCLGQNGACAEDAEGPERLRRPGVTIESGDTTDLNDWNHYRPPPYQPPLPGPPPYQPPLR
jgi:hypothetical protein